MKTIFTLLTLFLLGTAVPLAQRGKHSNYTVSSTNTIVNTYTQVTNAINAGSTYIQVADAAMVGAGFTTPLQQGDLIMIIQMQGLRFDNYGASNYSIDINTYPVSAWSSGATLESAYMNDGPRPYRFGTVKQYHQVGVNELVEVASVSGNVIFLNCSTFHSYYAPQGNVQVIRVPRYKNLTIPSGTSITAPNWNGTTGGVVAIEVEQNLSINAVGGINATGKGFRGGVVEGVCESGSSTEHTNVQGMGNTFLGTNNNIYGGAVGENIMGATTYLKTVYLGFGRGAIANGGGGGGLQNGGGGGGSNVGDTNNRTGLGVPNSAYNVYWNAERPGLAGTVSGGGGRGGYTYANTQQNPNIGPNKSAWGGDARKENGGFGGHALVYHPNRIFAGGGGGAGSQDSGQGGNGGNGGGIVYLTVYGTISGTGSIVSNGAPGFKTNMTGDNTVSNGAKYKGNDGAGGGGGGGYIYIKNMSPIPTTVSLQANGGNGGNVDFYYYTGGFGSQNGKNELTGPGAGGAGGGIAYTSGTPPTSVSGGAPGITLSNGSQNPWSTSFPSNGATNGGTGLTNLPTTIYDITVADKTICAGTSTGLTATITGTLPANSTIGWYTSPYGGNPIRTGASMVTGVLNTTTTYYVGVCPGNFRVPVTVSVTPKPVVAGSAIITPATCTSPGAISGLSITGNGPFTINWSNGMSTLTPNISNVSPGTYSFTVVDANGCTASGGPYNVSGTGGPVVSGTAVITPNTCSSLGSISGLTVTGPAPITNYSWNGTTSSNATLSAGSGSYTLTVTDANGCTATSGPYVIQDAPTPSIVGTASVTNKNCNSNGSVTGLSVTSGVGPFTYKWNGVTSAGATLTNAQPGSYTLQVTDANGCIVQSGPYTISVDPDPVIDETAVALVNPTCIATGSISGLTVTGGSSPMLYTWNGNPSVSIDATGLAAGNYVLIVKDNNGCQDTSSVFTLVDPVMPTISGTPIIQHQTCTELGSITGLTMATGTAPYTYLWNGNVSPTIDLTDVNAGSYTLEVKDANGCMVTSGPHEIQVIPPPVFSAGPTIVDATCALGGSISGITILGGVGPFVYSWSNGGQTLDISNLPTGSYTLNVKDANGCVITSGPHVVNGPPMPVVNNTATIVQATCVQGGSISGLTVSNGLAPYSYEWSNNDNTLDITGLTPGSYVLTVTDANGCSAVSDTLVIQTPPVPVISGTPVTTTVNCLHDGSISGLSVTGGTAPYTYSWNNGAYTTLTLANIPVGTYTLVVTDAGGCTQTSAAIAIVEDPLVVADFSYTPTSVYADATVEFHDASSGNIVQWQWIIDGDTTGIQHPSHVFTEDGVYTVTLTVKDANGCESTKTVEIEVVTDLMVPNVLTVNNDGVNDLFIIKGLTPNTELLILNRWGNLIYHSKNYDNSWDGRDASGNLVMEGVYTYSVVSPEGKKKHGFVHIVH